MFAAPGQGNLMAVVDTFAEDVDFQSPVTRTKPAEISSLKPRHGREEVAALFKEFTEKVQLERREELEITAEDEQVVGEGRERGIVRSIGLNSS
jgi:hypothetical protein